MEKSLFILITPSNITHKKKVDYKIRKGINRIQEKITQGFTSLRQQEIEVLSKRIDQR